MIGTGNKMIRPLLLSILVACCVTASSTSREIIKMTWYFGCSKNLMLAMNKAVAEAKVYCPGVGDGWEVNRLDRYTSFCPDDTDRPIIRFECTKEE